LQILEISTSQNLPLKPAWSYKSTTARQYYAVTDAGVGIARMRVELGVVSVVGMLTEFLAWRIGTIVLWC
jgi:hypothetical protein